MHVELGPIDGPLVALWCDRAEQTIRHLSTSDNAGVEPWVFDEWHSLIQLWQHERSDGLFRWTADIDQDRVECLTHGLVRILANRDAARQFSDVQRAEIAPFTSHVLNQFCASLRNSGCGHSVDCVLDMLSTVSATRTVTAAAH